MSLCIKSQEKLNEVVLEEENDVKDDEEEKVVKKRAFRISVANGVMGCRKRVQARELTVQEEDTVSDMKERAMKEFKLEKEAGDRNVPLGSYHTESNVWKIFNLTC